MNNPKRIAAIAVVLLALAGALLAEPEGPTETERCAAMNVLLRGENADLRKIVVKVDAQAVKWLRAAAKAGDKEARLELGRLEAQTSATLAGRVGS